MRRFESCRGRCHLRPPVRVGRDSAPDVHALGETVRPVAAPGLSVRDGPPRSRSVFRVRSRGLCEQAARFTATGRPATAVWAVHRLSWIGQASDTVKRSVPFETFSWPASCCETPPGIGFPRGHPDRFQLIRGDRRLLRGDPAFSTATLGSASREIVAMIHTTVLRLCAGLGREENHAKTRIEGTRHQVRGTPGEGGESAERTRLVQFAPGAHPAAVGGGSRRRLVGLAAGFSSRGSCPGGKAGGISRSPEASR